MNKLVLVCSVLAVLCICASPISHAADLQAGWYANISHVQVYTYDPIWHLPQLRFNAPLLVEPGQYGPLAVTDGPYHTDYTRYVSVATDAYGVRPSESLVIPLQMSWLGDQTIAFLALGGQTNYNSNAMRLEFWHESTDGTQRLVWSQPESGPQHVFGPEVEHDVPLAGSYYFKVAVVPEPSGIISLACGVAALGWYRRGVR